MPGRIKQIPILMILHLFLVISLFNVGSFAADKNTTTIDLSRLRCTSASITNNGYAVLGSNYDSGWTGGVVYYTGRNITKSNKYMDLAHPDIEPFEWTSKYASIGFAVGAAQMPWAGMNERGLCFGTMALEEITDDPNDPRAHMSTSFWWQYVLDTCETVEEVMATDAEVKLETVDHFLFTDRYGNSAVIEFENGHMVFYTGNDLDVSALTNSHYLECRDLWNQVKHTSSTYDNLSDSQRRFCQAADMVDDFDPEIHTNAVNYMISILSKTGWDDGRSRWGIIFDCKNLEIHYTTDSDRTLRTIRLLGFNPSGNVPWQMIDVHTPFRGDITSKFTDIDWEFALNNTIGHMIWWGDEVPEELIQMVLDLFKNWPCSENKTAEGALICAEKGATPQNLRSASNPRTGNVLLTWNEVDGTDPSQSAVKCATMFQDRKGDWFASEFYTLSSGKGYNGNACPTYLVSEDCFYVVWDQADPADPTKKSSVFGQAVSGRGLPEGKVLTLAGGKNRSEAPQVYERISAATAPGKTSSALIDLIYYSALVKKKSVKNPGLYMVNLGKDFKPGKAAKLLSADVTSVGKTKVADRLLPSGNGAVLDQSILVPVQQIRPLTTGGTVGQPLIVAIGADNKVSDVQYLGDEGSTTPNLALFSMAGGDNMVLGTTMRNDVVTTSAFSMVTPGQAPMMSEIARGAEKSKATDAEILLVTPKSANGTQLSPSKSATIGYLMLSSTNGKIYRKGVGDNGKTGGPYKTLVKSARDCGFITTAEILRCDGNGKLVVGSNAELLVAWHVQTTNGYELRADVFTLKR